MRFQTVMSVESTKAIFLCGGQGKKHLHLSGNYFDQTGHTDQFRVKRYALRASVDQGGVLAEGGHYCKLIKYRSKNSVTDGQQSVMAMLYKKYPKRWQKSLQRRLR